MTATNSQGERKVATVLFADVVGSTGLGEELDVEPLQEIMAAFHRAAVSAIEDVGGGADISGDAVIGAFRNFELNQLAIEGHKGRAFYVEEEGVPAYDELILVAHRERLDDPRIGQFVTALERAAQYLINHPEESWDLFVRHRATLDDELNRRAWRDTLPRFALRPRALDHGRYTAFAAFLQKQGVIESSPAVETYAVELR